MAVAATCRAISSPLLLPPLPSSRFYGSASSFHFAKPYPTSPSKLPSICLHLRSRSRSPLPVVVAAQSNIFRVFQTAIKVGKNVIETGTSFVPESVPRPIAKISVGVVSAFLSLFLLKSILSTAFFVLAMMGIIYFLFLAFNSDEDAGSKGDSKTSTTMSSEDDSLEEARRIMDKYK